MEGGETMEISAKGICPLCFEPVWPEESSVTAGGKTYHAECYHEVERRVEQLTKHARKTRRLVRNARLAKVVAHG
jgi:hypothetical protein